jgi:hypothetical protein
MAVYRWPAAQHLPCRDNGVVATTIRQNRRALVRRGRRLEYFTIAYNRLEVWFPSSPGHRRVRFPNLHRRGGGRPNVAPCADKSELVGQKRAITGSASLTNSRAVLAVHRHAEPSVPDVSCQKGRKMCSASTPYSYPTFFECQHFGKAIRSFLPRGLAKAQPGNMQVHWPEGSCLLAREEFDIASQGTGLERDR